MLETVDEVVSVRFILGILSGNSLMNGLGDGCGDDEKASAFQRET